MSVDFGTSDSISISATYATARELKTTRQDAKTLETSVEQSASTIALLKRKTSHHMKADMISTPLRSTLGASRVQKGSGSRGRVARGRCHREESGAGEKLASEFSQFLLKHDVQSLPRRPSHLMSPTLVVASQMAALQRNDWPEVDAGVMTAFAFSKPLDEIGAKRCRTWFAEERWITLEEFSEMLHRHPYAALIDCDAWQV